MMSRGNTTLTEKKISSHEGQAFGSRLPWFDEAYLKDATSFLFSNFPDGWSQKNLWYVFERFGAGLGRLADVFIPRKKDRKGGNFGFVRFKEVKDAKALIEKLNLIWFGSYKLRCTAEKMRLFPGKGPSLQGVYAGPSKHFSVLGKPPSRTVDGFPITTKSFKQVLTDNFSPVDETVADSFKEVDIAVKDEDWEWFRGSAVGFVHDLVMLPSLQNLLWDIGIQAKIYPLGGLMVLLKVDSKDFLVDFIKEEFNIWKQWFSSLDVWIPGVAPKERFIWLKVFGLPLHLWNTTGFEAVGNALGKFICADPDSINFSSLTSARLLVSIPVSGTINPVVKVKTLGASHLVSVMVDSSQSDRWWEFKHKSVKNIHEEDDSNSDRASDMDDNCSFWNGHAAGEDDLSEDFGDEEEPGEKSFNRNIFTHKKTSSHELSEDFGVDAEPRDQRINCSIVAHLEASSPIQAALHVGSENEGSGSFDDQENRDSGGVNTDNKSVTNVEESAFEAQATGLSHLEFSRPITSLALPLAVSSNSTDLNKSPIASTLLATKLSTVTVHKKVKKGRWIWDCFPSSEQSKFISRCKRFNKKVPNTEKVVFESRQNSSDSFSSWAVSDSGFKSMNMRFLNQKRSSEVNKIFEFGKSLGISCEENEDQIRNLLGEMEKRDGSGVV